MMKDLEHDPEPGSARDDHPIRKILSSMTMGASPASELNMWTDWATHLATAPDKQLDLARKAQQNWTNWLAFMAKGCPADPDHWPTQPKKTDRRFKDPLWTKPPYAAYAQAFLLTEEFCDTATSDIPGLTPANDAAMTFTVRQMLDAMAPSNFLATNPEALKRTAETGGQNLIEGAFHAFADTQNAFNRTRTKPTKQVGKDVAVTPGKVVLRTHLMELIQYAPATDTVHREPILMVPAWIMKYYILDLSPDNSMIRYLTEQGFTVFAISWRNPDATDAHLGMMDYLEQGPMTALDHICKTTGADRVHATGYCLGGTLMSIAAAQMARDDDKRLASLTLLAAQTDFTEAGELTLFINESQVSVLEDVMAEQGCLEANQMMSAFQMLRSNDLIWSRMIRRYLMGEGEAEMNDLMSWNADSTRMPARMHSEYLRQMFLNNDLAAGRYHVDGRAVSLRDIRVPIFGVGTETDHIAPWKSVFKIHDLGHADVTFALTNGGHNAGVISKPGHNRRHYRLHTIRDDENTLTPEDWMQVAQMQQGSWWPAWTAWLATHSGDRIAPPKMSGTLEDAPGTYVKME
ncbi:PHA/PHB synthase family protein [Tateyamaria omphalii]|nr:alpha/beta fold hydrolase [Tateyamaria omphalii]